MSQYVGKVVWFNNAKGFGFVSHEAGPDVFCHFSSIQQDGYKALKEGDPVAFDIERGDKGLQTANVMKMPLVTLDPAVDTKSE